MIDNIIFQKQKKKINNLFKDNKVIFAFLFGSRALKKENENSDFDIAIFMNEESKKQRFENQLFITSKLSALLKKNVDIVNLNDAKNNFLLFDILKEGKVIFCSDKEKRFNFETKKLHSILDFFERHVYKRTNYSKDK